MLEMLHRVFGIDTLQEIRFQIETLSSEIPHEEAGTPSEKQSDNAIVPGL